MAAIKKYSKAITDFITDKIEGGQTAAEICRLYPDMVEEKTYYRWKKKYPEFKKAVDLAYQTFFYKKIDEMEDLSKELIVTEKKLSELLEKASVVITGNKKDKKACEELAERDSNNTAFKLEIMMNRDRRDNIRVRMDALKFILHKLAPKMVQELADTTQTQVMMPSITIVNYRDTGAEAKLLN